jgi:hypothetical protein
VKLLLKLICIFSFVTSAFAVDEWINFSSPFPVKSAIPYGDGLLMATGGGIRYRTNTADDMYTTSNGLGDQSISAVVISDSLGAFAVSDNGIVSAMIGRKWEVVSRSYAGSNVHVIPGMVRFGGTGSGTVMVIAFEDRLSFMSVKTMTSILTIERIASANLSSSHIRAMEVRGDSLFVAADSLLYVRKMDWRNLASDVLLNDPNSWKVIKNDGKTIKAIAWKDGKLKTFSTEGTRIWDKDGLTQATLDTASDVKSASLVVVRGKTLTDSVLYEKIPVYKTVKDEKILDRYYYESKVRWVSLLSSGQAVLAGPDKIFHYDGKKLTDISDYKPFPLESVYELQALPTGGVLAAADNGRLSYYYFSGDGNNFRWSDPVPIYPPAPAFANGPDARGHNLKVLSVLPAGGAMYHFWGYGFFLYKGWADTLTNAFSLSEPGNSYCMDNYEEDPKRPPFTIAVSTTLAPDNMGYLTTSASNKGYSLVYIDIKGEYTTMSCANNVGSAPIGGPMLARIDENTGNWIVYVGTRAAPSVDAGGGLDVFTMPPPKRTGGVIDSSKTERKTFYGVSSTPLDMVYESKTDYLWMVTGSSLAYWNADMDSIRSPLSTNGLTSANFTSLDVDARGNLWAGTSSRGAYRLTPRSTSPDTLSVLHFTTRQGLLSDKIQDVAVDSALGMVWFAHENGVTRYSRNDLRATEGNMTENARQDVKVFPNPFRPRLQPHVIFDNVANDAVIGVYNRGGKLVASFSGDEIAGGRVEWDGRMKGGDIVAPGVYQYVVRGSSKTKKGKLLIIH